jgi:HEXXH motif-containing protein
MALIDAPALSRLQVEFRKSMRKLLAALCRDIAGQYAHSARRFALPLDYFRYLARTLDRSAFSNWKVVGWIEALNDLVYFLDLLSQIRHERDQRGFAEQLFAECEDKFFEHTYLDELFPFGRAQHRGLRGRLERLCRRLAFEIIQESMCLEPRRTFEWIRRAGRHSWTIAGRLEASFERAEQAYTIPIGIDGSALIAPAAIRKAIGSPSRQIAFVLKKDEIALWPGAHTVGTRRGTAVQWHWPRRDAVQPGAAQSESLTIGPTLHYGRNREPKSLSVTDSGQAARIIRAWRTIHEAWSEGHALLELLTSRVIPLNAPGVVSFSYRHRPGLSFINCFERDNLDLIDDVVHENSHHHLNLLLRKHVLYHRDRNQQIFYSPWRRRLRPLRGILHATFTFTMGALLFARLSAWAETRRGKAQWREAGLTARQLVRARFRCFEEIESVRYSLVDLEYARRLKWITTAGQRLVKQLERAIVSTEIGMSQHRRAVLSSAFGPSLRRHVVALREARRTYGPARLDEV